MQQQSAEFGKIRSVLWPIHSYELKKFLPMALMMMCILFNYSMLRSIKDALVVTNMGAEVIPTIKLWFVLPAAVLFMVLYSKLSNIFSKNSVFYIITSTFWIYYFIFLTVLFPNVDAIQFKCESVSPMFCNIMKPIEGWVFSSFYIMSELWGSAMVSLMFWKFANDVTNLKEAKRFYAMFGFIANGALILSGAMLKKLNSVPLEIVLVLISCALVIAIYWWLNTCVLTDARFAKQEGEGSAKKKRVKMSLSDSFKYIISSKYLGFIALLVICYGISINLVEVVWKGQIRLLYSTADEYNSFMGGLQTATGVATIIFMLIGANILRIFGWKIGAIITPVMILVTGLTFFGFIIGRDSLESMLNGYGINVLSFIVYLGLVQNVLAKATKYSLFDATKEMSYIPLDDELKSKGKAAVDVIGGRLGKSGGAAIQWLLLNVIFIGSNLIAITPIITCIFVIIMIVWLYAVFGLNKEFVKVTSAQNQAEK